MITTVLWDIDGTLLDFLAAEKVAIKALFAEFGLGECTDEMIARYSEINKLYWQRLERGEMTKPEILTGRFREFFASEGIDTAVADDFNARYQVRLGDTIVFKDDGYNIVASLRGRVKQYATSNGTVIAQTKKLCRSGLDKLFDGVFLSEKIGAEKPDKRFFDAVFDSIDECDKSRIMIVGDSLTSDIKGGADAGIVTCWYNPQGASDKNNLRIDYTIGDLHGIYGILGM